MKKVIIILIVILSLFFLSFLNFKEKEEKVNKNISVILETEEGNIKSNTFPNKNDYEYLNTKCENISSNINSFFNEETWKLNISVEEESIDGKFNCMVYFKEKNKLATKIIIDKYNETNSEGLIKLEQPSTVQTPALTEYRYTGVSTGVKNYVRFNNELWRIIGVFKVDNGTGTYEERLKIIRDESIGVYSWDTSASSINSGYGINQWGESGSYNGADLMRLLNPGYESESVNNSLYWNRDSGECYYSHISYDYHISPCDFSSTGLTSDAKGMIDDAKWYTAAIGYDITSSEAYKEERGSNVGIADIGTKVTKTTSWVGKVGLMNLSDYGYSSKNCYQNYSIYEYNQEDCTSSSWLLYTDHEWTINPAAELYSRIIFINKNGSAVRNNGHYHDIVRPVVFLKSDIKIVSGSGLKEDPYVVSL